MAIFQLDLPHVGSRVIRIEPLHFMAAFHTRRLNSGDSVSLDFLTVSVVLLTRVPFLCCIFCVFCLFIIRLSVPVQVTDWKDSFPK